MLDHLSSLIHTSNLFGSNNQALNMEEETVTSSAAPEEPEQMETEQQEVVEVDEGIKCRRE